MESERVALMDSWQTYVFTTRNECLVLITFQSCSGCGEKHTSVSDDFMSIFEVIHDAY